MKSFLLALALAVAPFPLFGQTTSKKPALPPHPNAPASEEIQTEQIGPATAKPGATTNPPGFMDPSQVKALTHKIWLAEFRLNDLLAQVHPDKWKMAPATRQSFQQSFDSLHKALAAAEDWRGQFEARPDSLYLGFQTYVAISAVLPRVDGVARSVSQYENASFGGQYSQAGAHLFDLQQMIEPHLTYLLKIQDGLILATQTNLASCQNELNFAEHDKEGRATPMKNIAPEFKGHPHGRRAPVAAAAGEGKPGDGKNAASAKSTTPPTKPTTPPTNSQHK